jgi:hypothetical protein
MTSPTLFLFSYWNFDRDGIKSVGFLASNVILTVLKIQIHEHKTYFHLFHLFRSSLTSFNNVLLFSVHHSFTYMVNFFS